VGRGYGQRTGHAARPSQRRRGSGVCSRHRRFTPTHARQRGDGRRGATVGAEPGLARLQSIAPQSA
jgi:hypothetical protein